MPEWLWIILVGGVVMGLVTFIMNGAFNRIKNLEDWKENIPRKEEIVTFKDHAMICKLSADDMKKFIKEEVDEIKADISELRKEIRKINGG